MTSLFRLKNHFSFGVTQRGLQELALCRTSSGQGNCLTLVRMPVLEPSRLSPVPLALRLANLEGTEDYDGQGDATTDPVHLREGEPRHNKPTKREFCKRCDKAASLCICRHFKTVVENKTPIVILQHPEEKRHHLGSARIALLGLQNVEIINLPEARDPVSCRIREKVPGSKRFLAGRGGKKAQYLKEELNKNNLLSKTQPAATSPPVKQLQSQHLPGPSGREVSPLGSKSSSITGEDRQIGPSSLVPPWLNLQPDAGLLFPSEKAVDLWPDGLGLTTVSDSVLCFAAEAGEGQRPPSNVPSQLIVLDGTWKKAKRIYFENPWLQSLPHYRLATLQGSRYGRLRPEPKPGFVSTVESIVLALQLLEPETQGLESLLYVFDSMMEDQVQFLAEKGSLLARELCKHWR